MKAGNKENVKLQVLIVAYGQEGIERVASMSHPRCEGVEYIVSWQKHSSTSLPSVLADRDDMRILYTNTIGLSSNRNHALRHATAPYVLISDDDVAFSQENFDNLFAGIEDNPGYEFYTFKYRSPDYQKNYPGRPFDLAHPPRGYYTSAIEIVFNMSRLKKKYSDGLPMFNLHFGINGRTFISGEDDMMIARLLHDGCKGRFVPKEICTHTGPTTDIKIGSESGFIHAKGALFLYRFPYTWPLRMLTHAWRSHHLQDERHVGFSQYCHWWLDGVKRARQLRVFKTEQFT